MLARAAWPDLPGHSLGAVCETLGLCETVRELVPGKAWHDALFDAAASLVLLSHLVEALSLQEKSLDSLLHPDTRVWHSSRRSN